MSLVGSAHNPCSANCVPLSKQVPCLADIEDRLALEDDYKSLLTKPHGSGDVHRLLHNSDIPQKWAAAGARWVCFFQDSNAPAFRGLIALLGACFALSLLQHDKHMMSNFFHCCQNRTVGKDYCTGFAYMCSLVAVSHLEHIATL